jgi:hypothetical protein
MENDLGRALRAHRRDCPVCSGTTACDRYIGIAVRFTGQRVVREGPRMAFTRLSVQEASQPVV